MMSIWWTGFGFSFRMTTGFMVHHLTPLTHSHSRVSVPFSFFSLMTNKHTSTEKGNKNLVSTSTSTSARLQLGILKYNSRISYKPSYPLITLKRSNWIPSAVEMQNPSGEISFTALKKIFADQHVLCSPMGVFFSGRNNYDQN